MMNECAKVILQLIPSHTMWCDRGTLQAILKNREFDAFEVGKAVRHLVQKRLLDQLVVNLPSRAAIAKSYSSEFGGLEPVQISCRLNSLHNSIAVPTEMIGPTKLWTGICGCNYHMPECQAEWLAHLRFSVALGSSNFGKHQSGKTVPTSQTRRSGSLFYAAIENLVLAVPLRVHANRIRKIMETLESKGAEYEIW